MKTHSFLHSTWCKNLALGLVSAAFVATSSAKAAGAPKVFRVTAAAANTSGSILTIDNPALNGKPTLRLIVTQYFTGVYNPHAVGVNYNVTLKKWQIFNEDNADLPVNANFNVMIAPTAKRVSVTPTNSHGVLAFFPTQKGNAAANLLVTHLANPVLTLDSVIQPNNVSLYYIPATGPARPYSGRWSIYQDNTEANIAAVYNVADVTNLKVAKTPISFRHSAVDANTTDLETTITNPLTDGKPDAVLFIQHVFTPTAAENVDEVLGVRYADGKWKILTQDQTDKLSPADFNVVAFPAVTP
ncbi:hypothetical protein [Luteolibacter sp. Populi]|uniref:DUF7452 domain-containing protein n=1 Tax=Luteolibacter sp. Populi TaxID=3230487 RepID=UPI0034669479